MVEALAQAALWIALSATAIGCAYLFLLVAASFGRRRPPAPTKKGQTRFAVIVPAHDEEEMIAATLLSLQEQDYPRSHYTVHLIADNCSDRTAEVGRAHGVEVHERHDPANPGKGQALNWLLAGLLPDSDIDAFVFIDADTTLDAGFLAAMDRRLRSGASTLQASYRVRDPESHPLVALRAIAFALFHDLRGRGKAKLGLSAGLWGNGMVLTRACLLDVPWGSFSSVEDAEQHYRLLEVGYRVDYVGEARVYGHMPAGFRAAAHQQRRWEGGRLKLIRRFAPRLLRAAVVSKSVPALAALVEMSLPPLSVHGVVCLTLLAVALLIGSGAAVVVAGLCLLSLVFYALVGIVSAHLPLKAYASLLYAPVYITWKIWLFASELIKRQAPAWNRTART